MILEYRDRWNPELVHRVNDESGICSCQKEGDCYYARQVADRNLYQRWMKKKAELAGESKTQRMIREQWEYVDARLKRFA